MNNTFNVYNYSLGLIRPYVLDLPARCAAGSEGRAGGRIPGSMEDET